MVGDGFVFIKSTNQELLEKFILLINEVIHDAQVLRRFRSAEMKKTEIESKVLDFKRMLKEIMYQL